MKDHFRRQDCPTDVGDFVVRGLREKGFVVKRAENGLMVWHAVSHSAWDIVIYDSQLPRQDSLMVPQHNQHRHVGVYPDRSQLDRQLV